jgi:hypothetical protein
VLLQAEQKTHKRKRTYDQRVIMLKNVLRRLKEKLKE